jgi:uncharacterized protein RhaS with RHS repeats
MYDPTVGRWLTEGPIGFDAGDANLFRYVGNDPTNLTDPSGLAPSQDFKHWFLVKHMHWKQSGGSKKSRGREGSGFPLASATGISAHQRLLSRSHSNHSASSTADISLAVQPLRQASLQFLPVLPQQPFHVEHTGPRLVRVPRRVQPPIVPALPL